MDLARQGEDWQAVAALGKEAEKLGLNAASATEWMPLLEAYVQLEDLQNAKRVARLIREDKLSFNKLCSQYEALKGQPAAYDRAAVYEALCRK
jgi:hypothetical protein